MIFSAHTSALSGFLAQWRFSEIAHINNIASSKYRLGTKGIRARKGELCVDTLALNAAVAGNPSIRTVLCCGFVYRAARRIPHKLRDAQPVDTN